MATSRFLLLLLLLLLLLQLGAVAAASSLLLSASRGVPVDAALPPPMMSRDDASVTTDIPRTVNSGSIAASVARRLGTPHGFRRRLSDDIPAAAPAAALDDDDISADAPDAADDYDYGYDVPAGAPEWWPDAAEDYDDVAPADAPAAASPSGDGGDVGAEVDEFPSTTLEFALFFLAVISGSIVISFLVVGLLTCAASLPSYVAGLYAAAKTAREKATRVRPLDDQDAGH